MRALCTLALLIAIASAAVVPAQEKAFVNLGGREYFFDISSPNTWTETKNLCRSLGMFIVSIETAEESELIKDHIMNVIGVTDFWTGGNDFGRVKGDYIWDSTGAKIIYTDWHPGEPSFSSNEHYIELRYDKGALKWNDVKENALCFTICEEG